MSRPGSNRTFQGGGRPSTVVLGILISLVAMFLATAPAWAAVSVSRAELSGSTLRIEGTATASRDITVDNVVMGRSGSDGRFRIERSGYAPPADCTVDVNDGSATARSATLSGCTVSQYPVHRRPPVAKRERGYGLRQLRHRFRRERLHPMVHLCRGAAGRTWPDRLCAVVGTHLRAAYHRANLHIHGPGHR